MLLRDASLSDLTLRSHHSHHNSSHFIYLSFPREFNVHSLLKTMLVLFKQGNYWDNRILFCIACSSFRRVFVI